MRKYLFTPDTQATGRKVLALGLAAILALSACLMAACTPSAEEGLNQPASSSQATGEEDITLAPLTLVTADDPLLAFAANPPRRCSTARMRAHLQALLTASWSRTSAIHPFPCIWPAHWW